METSVAPHEFKYEVWFKALTESWPSLAFPCDAMGRVPIDCLTTAQKNNYLFARGMMGMHYAPPAVQALPSN